MTHTFTISGTESEITFLFQVGAIRTSKFLNDDTYRVTLRENGDIPTMTTAKEVYEWSVKEDRIPKEFLVELLPEFNVGDIVESWVDEKTANLLFGEESNDCVLGNLLREYENTHLKVEKIEPYTMEQIGGIYCSFNGEMITHNSKSFLFDDYYFNETD